ncbi:MAG: hypothetical protein EAZ55_01285 [Cytophagales bacterium]|nr:MAG: hypothetical protein EAZ55_01285 [Cytophagales bacterium]
MGYNPNSVRGDDKVRWIFGQPIYEADVMYRTTVWRLVNLKEKQNQPFYSSNNNIISCILKGVREGSLTPYDYNFDAVTTGTVSTIDTAKFINDVFVRDDPNYGKVPLNENDIFILQIREDLIFDRRRSRMYWDIQSVTMFFYNDQGQLDPMGTFKYKDLYKFLKDLYDKSQYEDRYDQNGLLIAQGGTYEAVQAKWVNPQNPRRHMSMADAFELRMFSSRIRKISNPEDKAIKEIVLEEYQGATSEEQLRQQLLLSQKIEYDLMEYEHNLWEF